MKETRKGLSHFLAAFGYSVQGLASAVRHESAFRLELLLGLVHYALVLLVPMSAVERLLLAVAWPLLLVTELLNSAVENVVDLASPEWHELAKRAKDTGSAAVFVAASVPVGLWLYVLLKAARVLPPCA